MRHGALLADRELVLVVPVELAAEPGCSAPGRVAGLVFDYTTDLDHVADAYAAMDQRRAFKSLLTIPQH